MIEKKMLLEMKALRMTSLGVRESIAHYLEKLSTEVLNAMNGMAVHGHLELTITARDTAKAESHVHSWREDSGKPNFSVGNTIQKVKFGWNEDIKVGDVCEVMKMHIDGTMSVKKVGYVLSLYDDQRLYELLPQTCTEAKMKAEYVAYKDDCQKHLEDRHPWITQEVNKIRRQVEDSLLNKKPKGENAMANLFKKMFTPKQARQDKYGVFDTQTGRLDLTQPEVQEALWEAIQDKVDAKLEAREIEEAKKK